MARWHRQGGDGTSGDHGQRSCPPSVSLSGAEGATGVRLVNDEAAPAFKAMRNRPSLPAPAKGSGRPGQQAAGRAACIPAHDVLSVRKAHSIESQPNFFYKPQYSSPQYSQAFVEWMVEQYRVDSAFFGKAREASKKDSG